MGGGKVEDAEVSQTTAPVDLMSDGWLREGDLRGLQLEKIAKIEHEASFFAEGNL
jgi:hypothetical protein